MNTQLSTGGESETKTVASTRVADRPDALTRLLVCLEETGPELSLAKVFRLLLLVPFKNVKALNYVRALIVLAFTIGGGLGYLGYLGYDRISSASAPTKVAPAMPRNVVILELMSPLEAMQKYPPLLSQISFVEDESRSDKKQNVAKDSIVVVAPCEPFTTGAGAFILEIAPAPARAISGYVYRRQIRGASTSFELIEGRSDSKSGRLSYSLSESEAGDSLILILKINALDGPLPSANISELQTSFQLQTKKSP